MTYPEDTARIATVAILFVALLVSLSIMVYLWIGHVRAARALTTPVSVVPLGKPLKGAMLATGLFVVMVLLALNVGR